MATTEKLPNRVKIIKPLSDFCFECPSQRIGDRLIGMYGTVVEWLYDDEGQEITHVCIEIWDDEDMDIGFITTDTPLDCIEVIDYIE